VAREWREMNTVNIATAWHRLARLSKQRSKHENRTNSANSANSANSTNNRGALDDPRAQILERLAHENVEKFDFMNLTNIVWSLAVLDHHTAPGQDQFLRRACERVESAARLGARLCSETPSSGKETTRHSQVWTKPKLEQRYPASSDSRFPSAQALSNCFWAFTTMKHPSAHVLGDVMVEITPRIVHTFDPGRVEKRPAGGFVSQTISNQLWAFGALRKHPGDSHMDALARLVCEHVTHFKPQELTNILWAYAALTHYPGDECLASLELELARRVERGEFNPQNVSTLVLSLSTFPHDDAAARASLRAFTRALDHEKTLAIVPRFNFQDLANAVFGVSVLGTFASRLYATLWRRIATLPRRRKMSVKDLEGALMLYNGKLLVEAAAPRVAEKLSPMMPEWLETEAARLWEKQASAGTVSEFQREVSKRLRALGVRHALETTTRDKKMSMDILCVSGEGDASGSVALECDGPSHFCVNSNLGAVPLSRNHVRDTLLGARGTHVVSVPWDEWAVREDDGTCERWLRGKMATVGVVDGEDARRRVQSTEREIDRSVA
jgi:hypothetical protein